MVVSRHALLTVICPMRECTYSMTSSSMEAVSPCSAMNQGRNHGECSRTRHNGCVFRAKDDGINHTKVDVVHTRERHALIGMLGCSILHALPSLTFVLLGTRSTR